MADSEPRQSPGIAVAGWLKAFVGRNGLVGFDRTTVRRYVEAAVRVALERDGRDDGRPACSLGLVVEAVHPRCSGGHGGGWRLLQVNHDLLAG